MALSAGSPIFKGKLADIDVRWSVIADSVDDRTPEERDVIFKYVTYLRIFSIIRRKIPYIFQKKDMIV